MDTKTRLFRSRLLPMHWPSRLSRTREFTAIGVTPCGEDGYRFVSILLSGGAVKAIHGMEVLRAGEETAKARLRALGLRPGVPVILALSRRETLIKAIRVPSTDDTHIARMLPFEMVTHMPWPPEEGLATHEVVRSDEDGYSAVLLIMAQRSAVEKHLNRLGHWGVRPVRVEACALSAIRLLRGIGDDERPALLIADDDGTTYVRLSCGNYAFSRGATADEIPSDMLRKSLETDERHHGTSGVPTSVMIAGDRTVDLAVLNACIPSGLSTQTVDNFSFPVLNGAGKLDSASAVCVATALGSLELSSGTGLLPEKESRVLTVHKLFRDIRLLVILLLWLGGMLVGFGYYMLHSMETRLVSAKQAVAVLEKDVGNLKDKNQALQLLNVERKGVSVPLKVILELYKLTPNSIALTSLRYDTHGILTFGGEAAGFQSVYEYVAALSGSPLFKNVELKNGAKPGGGGKVENLVEFKVSCAVDLKERS